MASQQFFGNLRQAPVWLKEFGSRDHLALFPAKIDPAQFTDQYGVTVTTTATAAQSATSVAVTALTPSSLSNTTLIASGNTLIPTGTTLYFGGAKVATLTADAKIGDTTLTVAALPTALASGDVATYSKYGTLGINSGTFVGRTYAERDGFTAFGPGVYTDDELLLVAFDNPDVRTNADITLVRPGSYIAENLLPDWTSISGNAQLLAALRATYRCIKGAQ